MIPVINSNSNSNLTSIRGVRAVAKTTKENQNEQILC